MINREINQNLRKKLINLIIKRTAFYSTSTPNKIFPLINGNKYLFDLDCLWSNPESLNELIEIISEVVDKEKLQINAVVGLTTRAGAFGTVPIASVYAHKHKLKLLVLDEEQFCDYGIHPHTAIDRNEFENNNILIIKDVLLTGESLRSTFSSLKSYNVNPVALIVLIDLLKSKHWHPYVPDETKVIRLIEGSEFPELDSKRR